MLLLIHIISPHHILNKNGPHFSIIRVFALFSLLNPSVKFYLGISSVFCDCQNFFFLFNAETAVGEVQPYDWAWFKTYINTFCKKFFFEVGQLHWGYKANKVIFRHFVKFGTPAEISAYRSEKLPNFKKFLGNENHTSDWIPKIFFSLIRPLFMILLQCATLSSKIPPTF